DPAPEREAAFAAEPRRSFQLCFGEARQEAQGSLAASFETLQGHVEVLGDIVALGRYHVAGKIGQIGLVLLHASTDAQLHALGLEIAQMADCSTREKPPAAGALVRRSAGIRRASCRSCSGKRRKDLMVSRSSGMTFSSGRLQYI